MNDYLAKPVEAKALYRCVLKWIPRKLIVISQGKQKEEDVKKVQSDSSLPQLRGINPADGIRYTGSEKMWLKLLGDFYKLIDAKARKLENCLADGLIRDYTIEVHALKNTARMIGADHLSEWFFKMEQCGKAGDVETITKETPALIRELRGYKEILRPYGEESDKNKREVPDSEWITQLKILRDAMERFSLDTVDEAMQQLEQYRVPAGCSESMELLRAAVADVKMKDVLDVAEQMIAQLRS